MNTKNVSPRQIFLLFSMLIFLSVPVFASFPTVLVIDGNAYGGTSANDTGGNPCYTYTTANGVLALHGATGGDATWGTDANAALNSPTLTGSWNGGSSVTVATHTFVVPQVLVYYPNTVTPAAMLGSDGVQHQSAASGTINGSFVVAYSGLSDGYIFKIGTDSPTYRYQAGSSPVTINTANGWPSPNIFVFPSQITVSGQTLNATSYTDGFNNGYWSNAYYEGTNIYGELHVFIAADNSSGQMYGNIDGTDVSAEWNASTSTFVAAPGLGLSFEAPSSSPGYGSPQYGPPQVEWNGTLMPFAFNDVNGADVYWNPSSGKWAVINSSYDVTVTDSYTTMTGIYDPSNQSFGEEGPGVDTLLPDFAAVSADGMNFLGMPDGVQVVTSGWTPSSLWYASGYWGQVTNNYCAYSYSLYRPDGTAIFKYDLWWWSVYYTGNLYFQLGSSPTYVYSQGTATINATNGWPTGLNLFPDQLPNTLYVNNVEFSIGYTNAGPSWDDVIYYVPNGDLIEVQRWDDQTTGGISVNWSLWNTFNNQYNTADLDLVQNGGSLDTGLVVTSTPTTRQTGPAEITLNGMEFVFRYNSGADVYTDGNGNTITIDGGGNVTVGGFHSVTGSYNSSTYLFDFGGDTGMQNIAAQDGNGNLLGITATGLLINADSPLNLSLQFADGTSMDASNSTTYTFQRSDGSWGVKYVGLPQDAFLYIRNTNGGASPLYHYHATSSDFVVNANSNTWPETNIYPLKIYANGHYMKIDGNSEYDSSCWADGTGLNTAGGVVYRSCTTSDTISVDWTCGSGFSAVVSGSYGTFTSINGSWDGGVIFSGLPQGLIISVQRPPSSVRYGPPSIAWNGIDLAFDPVASSVSGSNPQGEDVYRDTMGLGLSATVGSEGSVTLYKPDGSQYTGTYNPATYQYSISGQPAGSVLAVNSQGQVLVPTVPVGGSGGGGAGTNTGALGNFDIQGNVLSLGNWTQTSGGTMNGLSIVYTDTQGGQPSLLSFMAARQSVGWIWSHADTDGGSSQVTMMQLDATSRLMLSGTANPSTPAIILDPNGKSHIEPQGNLDMGVFTAHP